MFSSKILYKLSLQHKAVHSNSPRLLVYAHGKDVVLSLFCCYKQEISVSCWDIYHHIDQEQKAEKVDWQSTFPEKEAEISYLDHHPNMSIILKIKIIWFI